MSVTGVIGKILAGMSPVTYRAELRIVTSARRSG